MSEKAAKKKAPVKKAASKKKAKKDNEEETPEAPAPVVVLEPAPVPNVLSRFEGEMYERRGKGYSFGELASVGLTKVIALSLNVPVDIRRRSVLEPNVDALKGWYKPAPKKAPVEQAEKPAKAAKKPKKKEKKAKKE